MKGIGKIYGIKLQQNATERTSFTNSSTYSVCFRIAWKFGRHICSMLPRQLINLTIPVWYDIFTPPYSHPGVKISYDIFTPGWKYRYDIFTPLTIFSPPSQSRQYMTDISFIIAGALFHPMSSSMGVKIVPRCIHPSVYFHWSDYIVPRYIHPHSLVPWEWLYRATIYPPPLSSSMGVIISCHDISTPTLSLHGSDYIVPRYIHPHSLVPWESSYHATIYPSPLSSSMGVIISCHDISTATLKFHGSDYIVPR